MIRTIFLIKMKDEGYDLDTLSWFPSFTLLMTGLIFVDDTDIINTT